MRLVVLAAAFAVAGCASMKSGPTAVANLEPTKGNRAAGTVTFTQEGDRVRLVADVTGLNAGQ
jgi:superoxide dismutase, Cu-Zn family